jgi:hypothetical protein
MGVDPGSEEEHREAGTRAFAIDGTAAVTVSASHCLLTWDTTGRFVYLNFPEVSEASYALQVTDSGLPKLPSTKVRSIEDIANARTITTIPLHVESAVNPAVYAYTRFDSRHNLYRIQLR